MGGTSRCKGLVRIREHVVFDSFSSVHELDENVKEASSSSFNGHFGRLSDNVWHFCVSRTSSATLEWFPVDAGTESSKEEKDTWCPSSSPGLGGATLVATTNVSSVEAVDGENVKLSEVFGSLPLGSHKRSQLESCSFYVEDKVLRAVLLIETETQTQRDEWVQFLGTLLSKKEDKLKQEVDTQEAGEDVVEDLESLHLPAPSPSISARLMLHQGKSKNLMEEEDPFGLLSLTTSALDSFKTTTTNPAPGMFAMDHFGLTEGIEQEHNIEDANDSDDSVTNIDLDCVADTVMDSSSWLVLRQQQSRERSYSHATYSNSSNMVREPYTGTSRRHSMGGSVRLSARWQLLISLQEAGVYYASIVDEAGGLSRLLVQNVENCLETMDFYWPQFLHWGFVNLSNASPSVRVFYLFFLTATAHRSVNLALKATWECIAAHWDAMAGGYYKRGNEIVVMLFFVTNINFGEPQSVLPQLLFPQAPAHQRESFGKLLERLYEYVRRVYAVSQRESPFFEWLLARSKEEVVVSSRNVQKQLRACDGVLDPFPTNYHEEAQLLILERRRSGTQRLVETKQRLWNKPAQHIFSDEVRLV
ncbi:unnamed protein product [Peronospora destructor]|uniref:PH domain-containing protein n=1 Tax=Peronospora destructor TaxID=86335 RepID=A0AAV0UW87_9STRA|nr:unnamed protein product [Peronospora destructor]